jgi:predicted choloylglycine hydrolase
MPHDGWRETLPYYISMYKSGTATVMEERLVAWYRVNKNGACSDGGTTGNTVNQLQFEYSPNIMMEDRVFYDVLLTSNAQVQVSIGGVVQAGGWD